MAEVKIEGSFTNTSNRHVSFMIRGVDDDVTWPITKDTDFTETKQLVAGNAYTLSILGRAMGGTFKYKMTGVEGGPIASKIFRNRFSGLLTFIAK